MKHLKSILAILIAIVIYFLGISLYLAYFERASKDDWSLGTVAMLITVVCLVAAPIINYWEAKARRWFGLDKPVNKKPEAHD